MALPILKTNQPNQPQPKVKTHSWPFRTRRLTAWITEIGLVTVSGLVFFGIGAHIDSRGNFERVPLNPVLVVAARGIAKPLALPVSSGIRNVATSVNFLWMMACLAPGALYSWQLYLLAKTGTTIIKSNLGVAVVNQAGEAPGLAAVLVREGIGRWGIPVSIAYILWRYSFAFPNLVLFAGLALLLVLAEALALPSRNGRRAFHDWLAGTYVVDMTPSPHPPGTEEQPQAIAAEAPSSAASLVAQINQNPKSAIVVLSATCAVAVLSALVATQVYLQNQQNQRQQARVNSQKFLELVDKLTPTSNATTEQRQKVILAMGGLHYQESIQFLADLLVKETNPILVNTIQQALVSSGVNAIAELKQKNKLLVAESQSAGATDALQSQLKTNQETINKILSVHSGNLSNLDLNRVQLSDSGFNLVLNNIDVSGIKFKSAYLNQGTFKGSIFRSAGADGKIDTSDDAIADLTQAQLKQSNFTDANLSRVIMNRTDLNRATLNRANLSFARLIAADLGSAQLVGANLKGAVLEKASLIAADIGDAKLNEVNLYGARLTRVIAIGTQFSHSNLANTEWRGADLSGSYLDWANLSNANLSATRLTGAILRDANLQGANLQNADLSFADLRNANVIGADFQNAILAPVTQNPSEQFVETPDTGSVSAVVKGVDFSYANNLDPRQIAYICIQGGIHPRCP